MSLVEKHFKNKKCTDADVKEKFLEMKKKTKDRLNVAILYFLTSVIKGNAKRGKDAPPSDRFLQRVASDAEFCRTFPWGRYTFNNNLDEVKKLLTKMDGKVDKEHVNFPGFITSLELLAFEAIPALMNEYREKVEVKEDEEEERLGCPRMCKTKFKHSSMKGWSTSDLYTAIGETKDFYSNLMPTVEEKELLYQLYDPTIDMDLIDDVVASWFNRLGQGRSIWLEEMFRADIEGREKVPRKKAGKRVKMEKPKEPAGGASGSGGERSMRSVLEEMGELREIMEDGWKGFTSQMDGIVGRLDNLDSRMTNAEETIMILCSKVNPPVVKEPEGNAEDTSASVANERKRKRKTEEKVADDLEDITPSDQEIEEEEEEEPPKKKAPAKKKTPVKKNAPAKKKGKAPPKKKTKTKRVSRVGVNC